jgi:class 3 adenylate cyclase
MEILHELFLYNRLRNTLNGPVKMRIGIHPGMVRYSRDITECLKGETAKRAVELESKTAPDSLAISRNLVMSLGQPLLNLFTEEQSSGQTYFRQYFARLDKI